MDAIKALAKATVSKDAVVKKDDVTCVKSAKFAKSSSSSNTFKPVLPMMMHPRLNVGQKVDSIKSHHFDWDLEDTDEAIRIDFSRVSSSNSRKRKTSETAVGRPDPSNLGPQLPNKISNSDSKKGNTNKKSSDDKSSNSNLSESKSSESKSELSSKSVSKLSEPKSSSPDSTSTHKKNSSAPKPPSTSCKAERPDHDPADMERLKIKTYEERKARLESSKRYSQRTIRDEKLSFGIEENWKNVFFRNLSPNFSQSDLKKLALGFGKVVEVVLKQMPEHIQKKGRYKPGHAPQQGMVLFEKHFPAKKCVDKLNDRIVAGNVLYVARHKSKDEVVWERNCNNIGIRPDDVRQMKKAEIEYIHREHQQREVNQHNRYVRRGESVDSGKVFGEKKQVGEENRGKTENLEIKGGKLDSKHLRDHDGINGSRRGDFGREHVRESRRESGLKRSYDDRDSRDRFRDERVLGRRESRKGSEDKTLASDFKRYEDRRRSDARRSESDSKNSSDRKYMERKSSDSKPSDHKSSDRKSFDRERHRSSDISPIKTSFKTSGRVVTVKSQKINSSNSDNFEPPPLPPAITFQVEKPPTQKPRKKSKDSISSNKDSKKTTTDNEPPPLPPTTDEMNPIFQQLPLPMMVAELNSSAAKSAENSLKTIISNSRQSTPIPEQSSILQLPPEPPMLPLNPMNLAKPLDSGSKTASSNRFDFAKMFPTVSSKKCIFLDIFNILSIFLPTIILKKKRRLKKM